MQTEKTTTGLTEIQLQQYDNQGFIAPIRVLSEENAKDCLRELAEAELKWPTAFKGSGRNNAHYVLPLLDSLAHNTAILDAVESLIGPDILVAGTTLFIKEPENPGFISWHQDARYIGLEPHNWVTAWLALSNVNEENGCMRMVAGSHKGPLVGHIDTYGEDNLLTRGQTVPNVVASDTTPVILRPGELSLHHPRVVHGSGPNLSSQPRVGYAIQSYIGTNVNQVIGDIFVQQARGKDEYQYHQHRKRVRTPMSADDIIFRDISNKKLSEIFYAGAEKTGKF